MHRLESPINATWNFIISWNFSMINSSYPYTPPHKTTIHRDLPNFNEILPLLLRTWCNTLLYMTWIDRKFHLILVLLAFPSICYFPASGKMPFRWVRSTHHAVFLHYTHNAHSFFVMSFGKYSRPSPHTAKISKAFWRLVNNHSIRGLQIWWRTLLVHYGEQNFYLRVMVWVAFIQCVCMCERHCFTWLGQEIHNPQQQQQQRCRISPHEPSYTLCHRLRALHMQFSWKRRALFFHVSQSWQTPKIMTGIMHANFVVVEFFRGIFFPIFGVDPGDKYVNMWKPLIFSACVPAVTNSTRTADGIFSRYNKQTHFTRMLEKGKVGYARYRRGKRANSMENNWKMIEMMHFAK